MAGVPKASSAVPFGPTSLGRTEIVAKADGLAVNVAGKLYIADAGNNRIVNVTPGSRTGVVSGITGGVTLSGPKSVAVDRVFV